MTCYVRSFTNNTSFYLDERSINKFLKQELFYKQRKVNKLTAIVWIWFCCDAIN